MRTFWMLFIGTGISALFFHTGHAQSTEILTVEESVERGLEYNFRLHAAEADAEAAEASYRMSRAARLPSIRSQASYMRLSDNIPSVDFVFPGTDTPVTLLPFERNQFYSEVIIEQPL